MRIEEILSRVVIQVTGEPNPALAESFTKVDYIRV